jgi:hypothetical protein
MITYNIHCEICKKLIKTVEKVPHLDLDGNIMNDDKDIHTVVFKDRIEGMSYLTLKFFCNKKCYKKVK